MTISRVLRPSSVAKIKGLARGDAVTPPTSEPRTSREDGRSVEAACLAEAEARRQQLAARRQKLAAARVADEEARRQELAADWFTPTIDWVVHREAARARVDEEQHKMSAARKLVEEAEEIFATANLVHAVLNGGRSAQSQTNGLMPPTLNLPGPLAGGVDASLRDLLHVSSVEAMARSQTMLVRQAFQQGLSDSHWSWVPSARQLPILPPVKWPHGI